MWSYGAEHELSDWDTRKGLPQNIDHLDLVDPINLRGSTQDDDYTMVNSNGICVDPKSRVCPYGGEVQTPPTWSIQGQVDYLALFLKLHPNAQINYRSNLHIHIRVPGLKDDLEALKKITRFNYTWLRERLLLNTVEPIPKPQTPEERKRYNRRKRSHHTTLSKQRVEYQLKAKTLQEFFEREVPRTSDGKPHWIAQPRAAVNLRQLLQTDTIEFRHWPGTLADEELRSAFLWCKCYLRLALGLTLRKGLNDPLELWDVMRHNKFPQFQPYIHWMEQRYERTNVQKVGLERARQAIAQILAKVP
jgi:hypothetical protein